MLKIEKMEIIQNLPLMLRIESLDCFQFIDRRIFDQQIQKVFLGKIPMDGPHQHLPMNRQPGLGAASGKLLLINPLIEKPTHVILQLKCQPHHDPVKFMETLLINRNNRNATLNSHEQPCFE